MVSKKQLKLLLTWKNNLFSEFCIQEIMQLNKKTTKTWVFETLKILEKSNLITKTKKSNLNLYKLNLKNVITYKLLNQQILLENVDFPKLEEVNLLISSIPYSNYCLIIFGSYVKNKQTKTSDLDICLITEDYKKIKPYINDIKLEIDLDVNNFTKGEFLKMLIEENLRKQMVKNNLVVFNEDIYYQILIEAHRNGYKTN